MWAVVEAGCQMQLQEGCQRAELTLALGSYIMAEEERREHTYLEFSKHVTTSSGSWAQMVGLLEEALPSQENGG